MIQKFSTSTRYPRLTTVAQIAFYPMTLAITLLYVIAEANNYFGKTGSAYGWYLGGLISTMILLEFLIPMRDKWKMTGKSLFQRDLPMLLINGSTVYLTGKTMLWLTHSVDGYPIAQTHVPWWGQAILIVAISDFIWYWVHRYCHEGKGTLGQWMWRTHSIHHLPEQVYVFMHVVGHPIQASLVRVILILPAILLGLSTEAVLTAAAINGLQGLVSHFNVDSRAGFFNRILVGTELHRYHHSVDVAESGNYASVLSVFDWIFGTYRLPGLAPEKLGVRDRDHYPANSDWVGLMKLPFRGR